MKNKFKHPRTKMKQVISIYMLSISLIILSSGCISYTTLQSAKPLEPGKVLGGVGSSLLIEGKDVGFMPEAHMRIGILPSFDIGGKYIFPSLFFLDGKVQLIDKPFSVSADLGWSYFSFSGKDGLSNGISTGWYPMIIIGQDHWYAAVKRVYMTTQNEFEFFGKQKFSGEGWAMTNVVVGGVIGTKFRLVPEVNFIIPSGGRMFILPAVGLQFAFN
jgi:hypothetical protein